MSSSSVECSHFTLIATHWFASGDPPGPLVWTDIPVLRSTLYVRAGEGLTVGMRVLCSQDTRRVMSVSLCLVECGIVIRIQGGRALNGPGAEVH